MPNLVAESIRKLYVFVIKLMDLEQKFFWITTPGNALLVMTDSGKARERVT